MFSRLWRRWQKQRDQAPGKKGVAPSQSALGRPCLEVLEDRMLLSSSIPLNATSWTPLGPAPMINGSFSGNSETASGRVTGIAGDPKDANTIFLAAASGGIWKSVNGGNSWTPMTDNVTDAAGNPVPLFMGAVAETRDSLGNEIVYAGTGEPNQTADFGNAGNAPGFYGEGILKSTNGGVTWTLQNPGRIFDRMSIYKIAIDPTNANIAYAAVGTGTNGAFDVYGNPLAHNNTGVFKTTNGGLTWSNITSGISTTQEFTDVVIDPNSPTIVYIGVGSDNSTGIDGVYKSTNSGGTWNLLTGAAGAAIPTGATVGRVTLALASNSWLYVAITDPATGGLLNGQLYRTTDTGVTFNAIRTPNYLGGQGDYDTALAIDPTDPNRIFAAGQINLPIPDIIESPNGGASWFGLSAGNFPPHTDHHALVFDAIGRLLDGNDGGIWRLNDSDVTNFPNNLVWQDLNTNLSTTQMVGVALDPQNANIAYTGTQDNNSLQFNNNLAWSQVGPGGDGGNTAVDPFDHFLGQSAVYVETAIPQQLSISKDGGITFNPVGPGLPGFGANFYPTFIVDPNPQTQPGAIPNTARVLFGSDGLWQSINQGATWTEIGIPGVNGFNIPSLTNAFGTFNAPIDTIAVAPGNSNIIYVESGGSIFVTRNGNSGAATQWTQAAPPPGFPNGPFSQIAVDPNNPLTAYVVRDAFSLASTPFVRGGLGHVFKTVNGGTSWTDISGNLPNVPVDSIVIDPNTAAANRIYLGTDVGIYTGTLNGGTWNVFRSGLPNAQVSQLEIVQYPTQTILAAATYGRGLFETLLSGGTVAGQDHLTVLTQPPASVVAGTKFGLVIEALNSAGAVDTSFNGPVTISLGPNAPAGSTVGGTVTVNAVNGVATWGVPSPPRPSLILTKAGSYTLVASASGASFPNGKSSVTTNTIVVTPGVAAGFAASPTAITVNSKTTITLTAVDAFGNTVTAPNTSAANTFPTATVPRGPTLTPVSHAAGSNTWIYTLVAHTLGILQIQFKATLTYAGVARNLSSTITFGVSFGSKHS